MSKMTVIPAGTGDPSAILDGLISEPRILFTVFRTDDASENLAERAEKLTGDAYDPRWVVFFSDKAASDGALAYLVNKLKDPKRLLVGLSTDVIAAIVTSLDDEIQDIIKTPASNVTNRRIFTAWLAGDS